MSDATTIAIGSRVTRSAKFLRVARDNAKVGNGGTVGGGMIVGGDGGDGTVIGPVPGCAGLVFVLWDEENDCVARGINVANLTLVSRKNLDAHAAEHAAT